MKESDRGRQETGEQAPNQSGSESALVECPLCGAVGLPERIQVHNCLDFLAARYGGWA